MLVLKFINNSNHCVGTDTVMCWAIKVALLLQKVITIKKYEIAKWIIGRALPAGDTGRVSLNAIY